MRNILETICIIIITLLWPLIWLSRKPVSRLFIRRAKKKFDKLAAGRNKADLLDTTGLKQLALGSKFGYNVYEDDFLSCVNRNLSLFIPIKLSANVFAKNIFVSKYLVDRGFAPYLVHVIAHSDGNAPELECSKKMLYIMKSNSVDAFITGNWIAMFALYKTYLRLRLHYSHWGK